jgi:uncharacterized membrane protein
MSEKHVVLAIFPDEAAADAAVEALKAWSKSEDEKLDAIGILCLDEQGHVKDHKLGKKTIGKGAGIGLALAMLTPVGLAAGVVAGGVLGAMHKKGLGLTDDNRAQLEASLKDGKAAVGALVEPHEADAFYAKLTELGGTVQLLEVSEESLAEAASYFPSSEGGDEAVIAPARGG